MAHGLSCSTTAGIFRDQGLNPCPSTVSWTLNPWTTTEALGVVLRYNFLPSLPSSDPFFLVRQGSLPGWVNDPRKCAQTLLKARRGNWEQACVLWSVRPSQRLGWKCLVGWGCIKERKGKQRSEERQPRKANLRSQERTNPEKKLKQVTAQLDPPRPPSKGEGPLFLCLSSLWFNQPADSFGVMKSRLGNRDSHQNKDGVKVGLKMDFRKQEEQALPWVSHPS